jgi:hypothetical protein
VSLLLCLFYHVHDNFAISCPGLRGHYSLIGASKEGRLAIDSTGNPHVAYTTTGTPSKIGYRMYDGSNWTDEALIERRDGYEGSCSKPDIAVDSNGKAHITYTESEGSGGYEDIMYATNSSGSFVKNLVCSGWYSSPSGCYYEKGSFITVDDAGNYYILIHKRYFYGTAPDQKNYYVDVYATSGSKNLASRYGRNDPLNIFDIITRDGKMYALYTEDNVAKSAELIVSDSGISVARTINATGITAVYSHDASAGNIVIGGRNNNNNLQVYYNGAPIVFSNISVKGNAVSIAHLGEDFYAAYSDNSDSNIKIQHIQVPYNITVANTVGGTATVTTNPAAKAEAGATVTVNITNIEAGKQFKSITVTDADSGAVETTEVAAGEQYTFTMPAKAVTVTVELEEKTVAASIQSVTATNGSVTITLAAKPTAAPVEGDFTATIAIDGGEATALALTNFNYDENVTVTYNFAPIVQTEAEQSVVVTVKLGEGEPVAAETFTVAADQDKAAVAAAKAAIDGATYTNLEVEDLEDHEAKTAAVQAAVTAAVNDDTITAVVTWNSETSAYDVAISKGDASDNMSITTATFVLTQAAINERLALTSVSIADNKAYASTAAGGGTVRVLGYGVWINLDANSSGKKISDTTSIVVELYKGETLLGQQTFNEAGYNKHANASSTSGTIDAGGQYVATSWNNSWSAAISDIPDKAVAKVQYTDGTATAEMALSFTEEQTRIFYAAEAVHALFADPFADELTLADGVTLEQINAASTLVEAVTLKPEQNKAVLQELITQAQALLAADQETQNQADVDAAMALLPTEIDKITVSGGDGAEQTAKTAAVKSYMEAIEGMSDLGVVIDVVWNETNNNYNVTVSKGEAADVATVSVTAYAEE